MTERRLLVVDDDPDFGDFVRQVAEGSGYQVTVTTGGQEFMEVYDDVDPTAIVLDMVMPEIEGTELVHACRRGSRVSRGLLAGPCRCRRWVRRTP